MQYKEGTPVLSLDEEHIGDISRIVLNPRNGEVTHLVVRKGFLFSEDRVIPVSLVASASPDRVMLRETKDALPEFPPFVETHFVTLDDEDMTPDAPVGTQYIPPLYGYPPAGLSWWGYAPELGYPLYTGQAYNVETTRNIPPGTIALSEGAHVISADGREVGEVEQVIVDSSTGQATHLVIAKGWLFTERKMIPTAWIDAVKSDGVRLSVRSRLLERLPSYEG